MIFLPYDIETPAGVKNAKVGQNLLINQPTDEGKTGSSPCHSEYSQWPKNTDLERLADVYGTAWTTTLM